MEFENPLKSLPTKLLRSTQRHQTLINLRWLAIVGVGAALGAAMMIGVSLPYGMLFVLLGLLAIANVFYLFMFKRASKGINASEGDENSAPPSSFRTLLFLQIATDWVLLTAFLHYSGGIQNPFVYVYVLHMIIGVTMSGSNITWWLAGFGMTLITGVTALEYFEVIPYYPVAGSLPKIWDIEPYMLFGRLAALAMVLAITGYMTHFLVDGIRQREEKLFEMSRDLVKLSNVKSEFLYRVTHELKSPVAAMMSAVDAVLTLSKDCLTDRSSDLLRRIRVRGEGLLTLIKDLLEIAKLSTPNYAKTLEPVEPAPLLKVVCETEEIKAAEKKIEFVSSFGEVGKVMAETSALREVFSNLVSNAVRYTPENGKVTVRFEQQDGRLFLQVSDTGIGISEEDQKKLFQEFFRAANAKKFTVSGTGLGLAITKAHIEAFGGTISVSSKLGEGTSFTVQIPVLKD
jgi:signal transduction histidine kinase